jgi:hypothetical protein
MKLLTPVKTIVPPARRPSLTLIIREPRFMVRLYVRFVTAALRALEARGNQVGHPPFDVT